MYYRNRHDNRPPQTLSDGGKFNRQSRSGAGFAQDTEPRASAVRTRNFGLLVKRAGDETALGVRLNVSQSRVQELLAGVKFSDETAMHVEAELNLPNGWLDQANPKPLPAEEVPLEQVTNSSASSPSAEQHSTVAEPMNPTVPVAAILPSEPPPPVVAQPQAQTLAVQKEPTPMQNNANADARPDDHLVDVRIQNLMVLTNFPRGKSGLGALAGKSPANISHLLHRKTRFSRETASLFEGVLGLPTGWLDTPQTAGSVSPTVTSRILAAEVPARKPTSSTTPAPAAAAAKRAPQPQQVRAQPVAAAVPAATPAQLAAPVAPVAPAAPAALVGALEQRPLVAVTPTSPTSPGMAKALLDTIQALTQSQLLTENMCLTLLSKATQLASENLPAKASSHA